MYLKCLEWWPTLFFSFNFFSRYLLLQDTNSIFCHLVQPQKSLFSSECGTLLGELHALCFSMSNGKHLIFKPNGHILTWPHVGRDVSNHEMRWALFLPSPADDSSSKEQAVPECHRSVCDSSWQSLCLLPRPVTLSKEIQAHFSHQGLLLCHPNFKCLGWIQRKADRAINHSRN